MTETRPHLTNKQAKKSEEIEDAIKHFHHNVRKEHIERGDKLDNTFTYNFAGTIIYSIDSLADRMHNFHDLLREYKKSDTFCAISYVKTHADIVKVVIFVGNTSYNSGYRQEFGERITDAWRLSFGTQCWLDYEDALPKIFYRRYPDDESYRDYAPMADELALIDKTDNDEYKNADITFINTQGLLAGIYNTGTGDTMVPYKKEHEEK